MAKSSISEAESVVMEVLWKESPIPCEAVVAALADRHQWQESTIKTLLNRLLNKGAIRAVKDHRRYLYSPALTREDWLSDESRGFLNRMFNGRVAPLVAHFGKHQKLSKKDIAELKKLIAGWDDAK